MNQKPNPKGFKTLHRLSVVTILFFGFAFSSWLGIGFDGNNDENPRNVSSKKSNPVLSGGQTTVFNYSHNAFSLPAKNLTESHRSKFLIGDALFSREWVAAPTAEKEKDGLGPLFNARSCNECHFEDGRGRPPLPGDKRVQFLFFLGHINSDNVQAAVPDPHYGNQLQTQAISGAKPEGKIKITYNDIPGQYSDGSSFILKNPMYEIIDPGYGSLPSGVRISPRSAPAIPGMGLLEAISKEDILSHADPGDKDADGISGRPNYVRDVSKKKVELGRFGWKAGSPSIRHQVATAFNQDIGLTSSLFPTENYTFPQKEELNHFTNGGDPEIANDTLDLVVFYSQTLAVPAARNRDSKEVLHGETIFKRARCDACHTPTYNDIQKGSL